MINEKLKNNDFDIYCYFLEQETKQNKPPTLNRIYKEFFAFDKTFDSKYELYVKLSNELQFVSATTTFEQIKINFHNIRPTEENLKQEIRMLLSDNILTTELTQKIREILKKYVSKTWEYFEGTMYIDDNLQILYAALHNYSFLMSRKFFLMKKALLTYQEELIKKG